VPLLARLHSAMVRHLSWKGPVLMEATRLRLWEGRLGGMRRPLNDSGVEGAQALEWSTSGVSV
jgi:hypothetical protein